MLETILKNFPVKSTAFKYFYDEKNFKIILASFVLRKRITFNDGHSVSIQANSGMYCEPRIERHNNYTKVEVGYPDFESELLKPYAEDSKDLKSTVYGYVPMSVVIYTIIEHGGIKE